MKNPPRLPTVPVPDLTEAEPPKVANPLPDYWVERPLSPADQRDLNAHLAEHGKGIAIRVDTLPPGPEKTVARVEQADNRSALVPRHEQEARTLADLARFVGMVDAGDLAELAARLRKDSEDRAYTASLNYRRGIALEDIRCAILDTGHPLGDDSDPELTPLRLVHEVLAEVSALKTPKPIRPLVHWVRDELVSMKTGTPVARLNRAARPFQGPQDVWAPILFLGGSGELLGPEADRATAREWCEVKATSQGWGVDGRA